VSRGLIAAVVSVVAVLASAAPSSQTFAAPAEPAIAPDPAIRTGVLANGLRFAVLSHAQPKGAISILFRMKVGSIDETDAERGAAHFLEHIAFAGGRNIRPGELEKAFTANGVAFGRDQNATTTAYETTYRLDLAQATPENLHLAFAWMHDITDGLSITPEAVIHERDVVLRERDATHGPNELMSAKLREALAPELRVIARDPIGTVETVSTMDAKTLRAFYERWYRPENAIVVVVGDLPVDELERRVRETFSAWRAKTPAPDRPAVSRTNLGRGFEAYPWPTYHRTGDQVTLCVKRSSEGYPPDTLARLRRTARRQIWVAVLNKRLEAVSRQAAPPFHSAMASYADDGHELASICVAFNPTDGDWRAALEAGRTEVRRLLLHGPTQAEVKRAVGARLAAMRYGAEHEDSYPSASLAPFILEEIARGDTPASIAARYGEEMTNKDISAAEVLDQMQADWRGGGPILAVATSAPPEGDQEMEGFWAKLNAAPDPGPYQPPAERPWAYANFGPKGKVVSREVIADPGFVRLRFENGVVVNFKETPFSKDDAIVDISFGDGRAALGTANLYFANAGAQLLVSGGLAKNSYDDLRDLFGDRIWSAGLSIDARRFLLAGRTTASDLDVELQILTAFLTDPGFSKDMDAKVGATLGTVYRNTATTPSYAASDALLRTLTPGGPLVLPPPPPLSKVSSEAFAAQIRPWLAGGALEVTIVGDVSEQRAVDAVALTLGALPKRPDVHTLVSEYNFLRLPNWINHTVHATLAGAEDHAAVMVVWPLWDATPARRREERAMRYVAMLFQDALRHRLRDQMGEAYVPVAQMVMDDGADQGSIRVFVECTPAHAEAVLKAVRETAADLAAGKITAAELEAERKPMLADAANRKQTIEWWADILDGSVRNPAKLDDARTWDAVYGSISVEEVRAGARTWLAGPGLAAVAAPAAPVILMPKNRTTVPAVITVPKFDKPLSSH
jgi:zinc protease